MSIKFGAASVGVALALAVCGSAQATLFDRGGGMIYDSDQNVTWLQDANYAFTSGYYPFDNGMMYWNRATAWADALVFGGFDDWRLPTAFNSNGTLCGGFGCTNSEMGHLYYVELGNTAGDLSINTGPFVNVEARYWLSTESIASNGLPINAWNFWWDDPVDRNPKFIGYQEGGRNKLLFTFNAWAVRDGDVALPVPEPETYAMLLAGLGLLGFAARRRKQKELAAA